MKLPGWVLVAVWLGVVAADVAVRWPSPSAAPLIHEAAADEIDRVEIERGGEQLALFRSAGTWRLDANGSPRADQAAAQALVEGLAGPLRLEPIPGPVPLQDAGLASGAGTRVRLLTGDTVLRDLRVGVSAGGRQVFARLADSELVLRGRIPAVTLIGRPLEAWRDPVPLVADPASVQTVRWSGPNGGGTWTRTGERWLEDSGQPARESAFETLFSALGRPAVRVRVTQQTLPHALVIGAPSGDVELTWGTQDGGVWLQREPGVWLALDDQAGAVVSRLEAHTADQRLVRTPVDQWASVRLEEPGLVSELARSEGRWQLVKPRGVRASRQVEPGLAALASLQGLAVPGTAVGFPARVRVVVVDRQGAEEVVEIGGRVPDAPAGTLAFFLRNPSRPDHVIAVDAAVLQRIRASWSR